MILLIQYIIYVPKSWLFLANRTGSGCEALPAGGRNCHILLFFIGNSRVPICMHYGENTTENAVFLSLLTK